jgi:ABC-2 type transport system permease protein
MSALAPTAPAAVRSAGRPTFAHAFSAEWHKIHSVRSTFWTLLAAGVVSVGLSALLALAFVSSWDQLSPSTRLAFDPVSFGLAGTNFGIIALATFGVLVISPEYSNGSIRTFLAAEPNRSRYLAAKAAVVVEVTLVVAAVIAFASFFLSQMIFSGQGIGVSIGDPHVLRAVIGAALYMTLVALFSLSLGEILRHTAAGITTALGLLFVLPIFGNFLPSGWGTTVNKLLPSNAGSAIMNTRPAARSLSPWVGFGVFAGYTALALVIAFVLIERRDA